MSKLGKEVMETHRAFLQKQRAAVEAAIESARYDNMARAARSFLVEELNEVDQSGDYEVNLAGRQNGLALNVTCGYKNTTGGTSAGLRTFAKQIASKLKEDGFELPQNLTFTPRDAYVTFVVMIPAS